MDRETYSCRKTIDNVGLRVSTTSAYRSDRYDSFKNAIQDSLIAPAYSNSMCRQHLLAGHRTAWLGKVYRPSQGVRKQKGTKGGGEEKADRDPGAKIQKHAVIPNCNFTYRPLGGCLHSRGTLVEGSLFWYTVHAMRQTKMKVDGRARGDYWIDRDSGNHDGVQRTGSIVSIPSPPENRAESLMFEK